MTSSCSAPSFKCRGAPGRRLFDDGDEKHARRQEKADFRANAENLGSESATTPAGTFSCQHWRSKKDGTEVWISDKVTPWQLVKMSGKDENCILLVRLITDAKSPITGTPVSMQEMMKGMGR